jgi:hypothetical protein
MGRREELFGCTAEAPIDAGEGYEGGDADAAGVELDTESTGAKRT